MIATAVSSGTIKSRALSPAIASLQLLVDDMDGSGQDEILLGFFDPAAL
jgi:hypothetical protein